MNKPLYTSSRALVRSRLACYKPVRPRGELLARYMLNPSSSRLRKSTTSTNQGMFCGSTPTRARESLVSGEMGLCKAKTLASVLTVELVANDAKNQAKFV